VRASSVNRPQSMYNLFVVCPPGLESVAERELGQLGITPRHSGSSSGDSPNLDDPGKDTGGVKCRGTLHDLYRANLHLRTAGRVLVRLGAFHAAAFPELRRKAGLLSWEEVLAPGQPVVLRVTCHRSRLYHQGAVAQRIAEAIADRLGQPPPLRKWSESEQEDGDPAQLILARLDDDHCTVSADSSGSLLHRRGYRLATAKAPLRETVAAGILLASGWNTASSLLDPFCGSGTIPIEAALLAKRVPPGRDRRFAFMNWPNFDPGGWKALKELGEVSKDEPVPPLPKLIASDRDAGAIRAALVNAERAGVADCIDFSCRSLSAIDPPPAAGWIVTNPPYGVRVSAHRDLRNLYAQIGNVLRARCPGWNVAVLCNSMALLRHSGLTFDRSMALSNGGLRVRLAIGKIS
jgi:putative N6-adenine-specific DNA methylase